MGYELDALDTLQGKGHVGITSGPAEVSGMPGQVSATSQGGSALGVSWDEKGYNVAGAAPGEGYGFSKTWPSAPSPPALPSPALSVREGLDPGSVAVGAAGGAGAAAAGATACCCCVIL